MTGMNGKNSMLFITNLLPYPLDSGGKIRTYKTLQILSRYFDIDLFCFVENENDLIYVTKIESLGIKVNCIIRPIRHHNIPIRFTYEIFKSLFFQYPYVVSKYSSEAMAKEIIRAVKSRVYDRIYIDHLPLFQYVSVIKKYSNAPVILDQHNIEHELIAQRLKYQNNRISKIFLQYELQKLRRFEKKACAIANRILCVSEHDRNRMSMITNEDKCYIAPFFIENRDNLYNPADRHIKNILFLGTMSWFPNEDGIVWFYEKVFKAFNLDKFTWRLLIVGSDPSKNVCSFQCESVVVTGRVDDIEPYLKESFVSIVPLRIGSGIRIKILDILSFGIPVITTTIGCEGINVIDTTHVLIADTEQQFKNALTALANNQQLRQKLSNNGYDFAKSHYSVEYATDVFKSLLAFKS